MSFSGQNAALILAGIDGIGTNNADFWQKTGATDNLCDK